MHAIVVGAGIAGLSVALSLSLAGHRVDLVESASQLAEVGAGVQLTPSATKWFWKWGLAADIQAAAILPSSFNVISSETDEILGSVEFGDFVTKYGGPYLVIHRADLHEILHHHAVKAGTSVHLNSRVIGYDIDRASIKLKGGAEMHADLVVAADGINSEARKQFAGTHDSDTGLQETGFAAFRMMADVSRLNANPNTESFVATQNCNCVVGSGCSIMTYMVKGEQRLNIVLSHYDTVDTRQWTQERYREEIRQIFKGFSKSSKALLETALSDKGQIITNWPIYEVKPLTRWASDNGKFVMLGDAAHAMAFYLSMGVSMAVEDAAALIECLVLHENDKSSTLGEAMKVFEAARITRAGVVRDASLHGGHLLMSVSGLDKDARDEALRTQGSSIPYTGEYDEQGHHFATTRMSYGIIDARVREYFYGYDLPYDIRRIWAKLAH